MNYRTTTMNLPFMFRNPICIFYLLTFLFLATHSAYAQTPSLTNAQPAMGATSVERSSVVSVEFDQSMDGTTITSERFFMNSPFTGPRQGSISFNASTNGATLTPTVSYYPGEHVFAELAQGISNATGTGMLPYHIWSFYAKTDPSAGLLADSGQSFGLSSVYNVTLSDLNQDGDLDLITSQVSSDSRIYTNDGSGFFYDTGIRVGRNRDIAVGDVNGDGAPDLFCGGTSSSMVYTNDGSMTFYDSGTAIE